jgi:hypothetical protein
MISAKPGNLKCRVEQVAGFTLDVTLHGIKIYFPGLWVNPFLTAMHSKWSQFKQQMNLNKSFKRYSIHVI